MYDAIVVGARCAGAPTAMLLARRGHRVLLCDRGSFPSDTVSNGCFNAPGPIYLKRWGLLDRLAAAGVPPITCGITHGGGGETRADYRRAMYAPMRRVLDQLLVTAAVEAGAELREHFQISGVEEEDNRVAGVRGTVGDREVVARARIVVGADGRYSTIARAVRAGEYDHVPMEGGGVYAYFEKVPTPGFEFWTRDPGLWAMLAPSNDGLTHVATYVFKPAGRSSVRVRCALLGTPQERFERVIGAYPDLRDRVAAGCHRTPFVAHSDASAYFRAAYGPGWALVGDAGFHQGPWHGYGMSHAFRDADRLAAAIDQWLSGVTSFDDALGGYANDRDQWCRLFWNNILNVANAYREGRPHEAPHDGERPHVRRWLQTLRRELV
jgi:flavin-dependent dehydrogenase